MCGGGREKGRQWGKVQRREGAVEMRRGDWDVPIGANAVWGDRERPVAANGWMYIILNRGTQWRSDIFH